MRPAKHKSLFSAGWFTGVFLVISSAVVVYAQDTQPQGQIYLPPARGGTPLSFQIEAEAKYIAAQGAFLESAAVARKINAEAVAKEIQNSVEYVKAYFERRDLNRQARSKEERWSYQENEDRLQKMMADKIDKYFQDTVQGDVTSKLNWLLRELYVVQYMSPGDINPLDSPLDKTELEQIYLTDGGHGDRKLVVKATDGEVLKATWPIALTVKEFEQARKEFEESRDAVVEDIRKNGRAGEENTKRILKAVDQLLVLLESIYPQEKRKDPKDFLQYNSAKIFLQSLTAQVTRALNTEDRSVFNGSLGFNGNTTVGLIQQMSKSGQMFDKPHPGGDRVYNDLFMKMRSLYITLRPDKNGGAKQPAKN